MKQRTLSTYIIYYRYIENNKEYSEGFEAYGIENLNESLKWLHKEVKATSITVYKRGKDFDNNPDDVIEMRRYWK